MTWTDDIEDGCWMTYLPSKLMDRWISLCDSCEDPVNNYLRWAVPILYGGAMGYVPYKTFGSWAGHGSSGHDSRVNNGIHRFWFGVELDSDGREFAVYYPVEAADGDRIEILVDPISRMGDFLPCDAKSKTNDGLISIPWRHGVKGLCSGLLLPLFDMDIACCILA